VSTSPNIVSFQEMDFVGLIRVDNPPVNAINHAVRAGLADVITRAANNPRLGALLIMSSGDHFSAGADVNEFDSRVREPSHPVVQGHDRGGSHTCGRRYTWAGLGRGPRARDGIESPTPPQNSACRRLHSGSFLAPVARNGYRG
jgi:Enoyl-CoA hydratase/isomerase